MSDLQQDVVAFSRLFGVFERDAVCCGTVSVAQCVLLQTILEAPLDVSTLAQQTRVTKGAMTRLVDGLEERGWVERAKDDSDGRRVLITLTKAGRYEAKRLATLTEQAVDQVFQKIPKGERAQVKKSVALLRQAAEEAVGELGCC